MNERRRPLWESCPECGHMLYQHDDNCSKKVVVKTEEPKGSIHTDTRSK